MNRTDPMDDVFSLLPSVKKLKIITAVLFVILGCVIYYITHKHQDPNIVTKTSAFGAGTIYTIKHDGHWWVTKDSSRVTPVHHPDCPCGRLKP